MRHRAKVSHFGRKNGPRKALIRGLVNSLVEHGRVKTTLAKAKELRRHVERAVTIGKRGLTENKALHARRILLQRYPNEKTVGTLIDSWVPRFVERPGGYTRILKLGYRAGDKAEMAYIQFVGWAPSPEAKAKASAQHQHEHDHDHSHDHDHDHGAEDQQHRPVLTAEQRKLERRKTKTAEQKRKKLRKLQTNARRLARQLSAR